MPMPHDCVKIVDWGDIMQVNDNVKLAKHFLTSIYNTDKTLKDLRGIITEIKNPRIVVVLWSDNTTSSVNVYNLTKVK